MTMGSLNPPHILLCADPATEVGDVRRVLHEAHYGIAGHAFGAAEPENLAAFQAVVLDATRNAADCLAFCHRLRGKNGDGYLPTLYITDDPAPAARLESLESGADAYLLRPFDP